MAVGKGSTGFFTSAGLRLWRFWDPVVEAFLLLPKIPRAGLPEFGTDPATHAGQSGAELISGGSFNNSITGKKGEPTVSWDRIHGVACECFVGNDCRDWAVLRQAE